MSAALHLVPISSDQLRDNLEATLKFRRIKLENAGLRTFQTYDLNSRTVLFVQFKGDQPLCIVHRSLEGILFGNHKMSELPMTITCLRTAAKSIRPILDSGSFDAIGVTYGSEEFALVADAARLLEQLR